MKKALLTSAISLSLMGASAATLATTATFTPFDQVSVKVASNNLFESARYMAISNTGDVITQNESLEIVALHDGEQNVIDTCAQGDIVGNKITISGDNEIAFWRCDSRVRGATKVDGAYVSKNVVAGGLGFVYPTDYDFSIASKNGRVYNLDEATGGANQGIPRVGLYNEETGLFQQVVLPSEYNAYHIHSFSADGTHALIRYGLDAMLIDLRTFETTPFQAGESEFRLVGSSNILISNDEDQAVGVVGSCNWICDTSSVLWDEPTSTGSYIIESNGFEGIKVQDASSDLSTVLTWGGNYKPQLWNAWTGEIRSFEAFLLQYGANLQGWSDLHPVAISENGLFITGVGTNSAGESNKAFIVEIDPVAECTYTY